MHSAYEHPPSVDPPELARFTCLLATTLFALMFFIVVLYGILIS